jgi:hypothetical protein
MRRAVSVIARQMIMTGAAAGTTGQHLEAVAFGNFIGGATVTGFAPTLWLVRRTHA